MSCKNRRNRRRKDLNEKSKKVTSMDEQAYTNSENQKIEEIGFVQHIAGFTGQTVTVFVKSGGLSGLGFTGVLFSVNKVYIKLITAVGPEPSCSLGNSCGLGMRDFGFAKRKIPKIRSIGSVTCIPVNKIAAFVHNLL